MIPFASQRGGGQDLATHLLNARDNDNVTLFQVRGAIAENLHGAFQEREIQAHALTRCREYLYSMSVNPDPAQDPLTQDQYLDYIERAEVALGLTDQPRAIVFHEKFGREHCHVVWSRVDAENGRAVHLAYDHDKLMRVTRAFAHDHGLTLPAGYDKSRQVGQISLYEHDQSRQTGLSKDDHIREITEAWQQHDDPKAFVRALAERGYILATGKRPYVLVDLYGGMHALAKLIADKEVRTSDLKKFLGTDFPPESLPSVEEAKALVAQHRSLIEKSAHTDRLVTEQENLNHSQEQRRQVAEKTARKVQIEHEHIRFVQTTRHRVERDQLRTRHRRDMRAIRQRRRDTQPTGLAAFLGRITGVSLVQTIRARRADARMLKAYLERRNELKSKQAAERDELALRQRLQAQAAQRDLKSLAKIEARERSSLARDEKEQQRRRDRGDQGIPSVTPVLGTLTRTLAINLRRDFERASIIKPERTPDVGRAFSNAARDLRQGRQADSTRMDNASSRSAHQHDRGK
jgi:Relaxase/Mobilisation nuclease domain